jgi:hypothetical protein
LTGNVGFEVVVGGEFLVGGVVLSGLLEAATYVIKYFPTSRAFFNVVQTPEEEGAGGRARAVPPFPSSREGANGDGAR